MESLFVDKAMATRLELAEADISAKYAWAYAGLFPGSGACAAPVAGGYVSFAGSRSPYSRATGLGLTGEVKAAELDMIEDFLRYRRARPTLDICPFVGGSLLELIAGREYRVHHFLNQYVRPLKPGHPEYEDFGRGITITLLRQRSEEDARLWTSTVARGFAGDAVGTPPDMDVFRAMFGTVGIACFLARVDGEVAGGGAMKIVDGTALLSTASTLPSYRRSGVQSGLLRARLSAAANAGCDLASVMTVPGDAAQRNVTRAGFCLAYTRLTVVKGPQPV